MAPARTRPAPVARAPGWPAAAPDARSWAAAVAAGRSTRRRTAGTVPGHGRAAKSPARPCSGAAPVRHSSALPPASQPIRGREERPSIAFSWPQGEYATIRPGAPCIIRTMKFLTLLLALAAMARPAAADDLTFAIHSGCDIPMTQFRDGVLAGGILKELGYAIGHEMGLHPRYI